MLGSPCALTQNEEKLFKILLGVSMEKITFAMTAFLSRGGKSYSSTSVIALGSQSQEKCVKRKSGDGCCSFWTHPLVFLICQE